MKCRTHRRLLLTNLGCWLSVWKLGHYLGSVRFLTADCGRSLRNERGGREAAAAVVMAGVANGLWGRTVGTQWCCWPFRHVSQLLSAGGSAATIPHCDAATDDTLNDSLPEGTCDWEALFRLRGSVFHPYWPALQCRRGPQRWARLEVNIILFLWFLFAEE